MDDLEPLSALMAELRREKLMRVVLIPLFSEQGGKPLVIDFGLTP